MTQPVKIDIWSDIACPWCYIGKRRLEAGIDRFHRQHGPVPVEVEYHSFELAPDTPVEFDGNEVDFLVRHKGLPEPRVIEMLDTVTRVAASVGLDYHFDRLQHTNTVRAHQLLHYAKARGAQSEMKERLLRAYFVEGRHVGRVDDLADLAADIGLDRGDVVRSLAVDEYLRDVRADQRRAVELGIHAVPFFVIDGRYALSGAQRADVFAEALSGAADEQHEVAAS